MDKLPVIYIHRGTLADGKLVEGTTLKTTENEPMFVEYAHVVLCKDCLHWLAPSLLGHNTCNHAGGLNEPNRDGSSHCSKGE